MKRSELRAQVVEISGNRCEHPIADGRCRAAMVEMAHIQPRGMGHTGYRDTLNNVMAACPLHARSTDDLSSPEWAHVPDAGGTRRQDLAAFVAWERHKQGWDVS